MTTPIDPLRHRKIVFFTGAGMSAESGVPTYRGSGGIWHRYNWQEYACQDAFDLNPEKVLKFHELRRESVLACQPHAGHHTIAALSEKHANITVITQNIDGMHQRAGSENVLELHGSLWRLRCPSHGISEDMGETYRTCRCPECDTWLRPDIIWFGDMLDSSVMEEAAWQIGKSDLFISIGTSGVVWPAAGFPKLAKENGAHLIEINPEISEMSHLYDRTIRSAAGAALTKLFT